jgi:2,3-bisphosphoglycerate-dependent phosphoglycerate mutase
LGALYLVRHGQSTWNRDNRFTGWVDVPLTNEGRREMVAVGLKLRGLPLGRAFASALRRTVESAEILLDAAEIRLEVVSAADLNERFYGRLQGLDKDEAARAFGEDQVHLWRRSYAVAPPGGESLEDAAARILPYCKRMILPLPASGQDALVCAHGNTLRAIIMDLDRLNPDAVVDLEIPTGALYRYEIAPDGRARGAGVML